MNNFTEFAHLFRKPSYPVIVDIDGVLVAGETAKTLAEKLLRIDVVENVSYRAIDKTGESWTLVVIDARAVLSPLSFDNPTKLQLIRWYNNRANKSSDDVDYSEKSLSSKRRDRIVFEIASRLLAET